MTFVHGKKTTVRTDKGLIRGYWRNGVYRFLGIPYAKAERFKAPEEVKSWEGVLETTAYGPTARLMLPDEIGNDLFTPHRYWIQREDCQNLNVWTTTTENARKPVVVWLHGGGFFAGSSIEQVAYDGKNMALLGDVVCVSVNHRLNLAGYTDLRKYGYSDSVIAGNLDLVAALKWVRKNIEAFGGDPENVTIFGQSGGGGKVISLMNTPSAEGLFHKALIMSGTLGDFMSDFNADTTDVVEKWLEILHIDKDNIRKIETIDYSQLCQAYLKANKELGYRGLPLFIPQHCDKYLGDPMHAGFSEFARNIPVMIGSTFSEFSSLPKGVSRDMDEKEMVRIIEKEIGKGSDKLITAFRKSFPDNPVIDVLTYDYGAFRPSVKQWAAERVREKCCDTYMYLFKPEMKLNESCMPNHCADIPYFFHNTELVDSSDIGEATESLEKEMFERFMAFVRTGDVNTGDYQQWKKCSEGEEYTYLFGEKCSLRKDLDDELLDLLLKMRKPFSFVIEPEEK